MSNAIHLVDCSLRDGAFLKSFEVGLDETKQVVSLMDRSGVEFVEIGHGFGVGAGRVTGISVASDIEYCQAAKEAATKTKWGMFSIGDWPTVDELNDVLELEPAFLKVGIDPGKQRLCEKSIQHIVNSKATRPVLFLMKTYAWNVRDIMETVELGQSHGVRQVYLVDSAGNMTPGEVRELTKDILNKYPGTEIGFHAHNNLGLAVANTLAAFEAGATFADCSLMGIGRSGGNCGLEQLVFALKRVGIETNIDPFELLNFSREQLPNLFPLAPLAPLDVLIGYSGFHSSFLKQVKVCAEKHGVEVERLIVSLCSITKVAPTDDELEQAAKECLS